MVETLQQLQQKTQQQQLTFSQRELRGLPTFQRQARQRQFATAKQKLLTDIKTQIQIRQEAQQKALAEQQKIKAKIKEIETERALFERGVRMAGTGTGIFSLTTKAERRGYEYGEDVHAVLKEKQNFEKEIAELKEKYPEDWRYYLPPETSGLMETTTTTELPPITKPQPTPRDTSAFAELLNKYQELESKASSKIPTIERWKEQFTSRLTPEQKEILEGRIEELEKKSTPSQTFLRGVGTGAYKQFQEKPILTTGTTIGFLGLSKIMPYAVTGASKVLPAKAVETTLKYTPKVMTTLYGTSVALRVAESEKGKRGEQVGRILTGEIIPYITGTKILSPASTEAISLWKARTPMDKGGALFPKQKQLKKSKFEKLKEMLGKLEKKVAEGKDMKEQAKTLKEIKSKLKGEEQIKNFNKWVEELIEKQVIKIPTFEIKNIPTIIKANIKTPLLPLSIVDKPPKVKSGRFEDVLVSSSPFFKQTTPKQKQTQLTKQQQLVLLKPLSSQLLRQKQKEEQKQLQKQLTQQTQTQRLFQIPATQQLLKTKQTTKQQQLQQTQTIQKQIPRQTFRYRQPPKIPTRPFYFPIPKRKRRIPIRQPPIRKPLFLVETRRAGRWFKIGRRARLKQALSLGKARALKTLRASFRIKKGGVVLPLKIKNKFFRPAKREKGVVVEKRRFRLDMPQEVWGIQSARRKSPFF